MKTAKGVATIVVIALLYFTAAGQTTLRAYIDTALKNNPTLRSYRLRSSGLQKEIAPAKALDDPMLTLGLMNLPTDFSLNSDMMTMKQIGLSQNFSVRKKYRLKGDVAQEEYNESTFSAESERLALIYQVKSKYYDLYANERAIALTQNGIVTMETYLNAANTRYSAGEGTQQDVMKAQVELTKMKDMLIRMESMNDHHTAEFNRLLSRDPSDSVVVPARLSIFPLQMAMDSMYEYLENNNPALLGAKTEIKKDSVENELMKTSKIPDFNAEAWYGQRQALEPDGRKAFDMVGFTVGMSLPVWSGKKQDPMIAASALQTEESQSREEAVRNQLMTQVHHAMLAADENQRLVDLYTKQLIPQAEQNLSAGIAGYQQNKIDFLTLTDNFLSLYNYRIEYEQAVTDYLAAVAELEMLTGKNLEP